MANTPLAWHRNVLPVGWERAASDLEARSALGGFYLAGGTGLALAIGHRRSVDLDLFSKSAFEPARIRDVVRGLPDLTITRIAPGTVHVELRGVLISFLHFPYPLLFPTARFEALDVADPRDVACMKLNAIAGRGNRRDFVDVYVAAERYGLLNILGWFDEKFRGAPYSRIHTLKSLMYFADAEAQPMPNMLQPLEWYTVRRFFETEVSRLLRQ